MLVADRIESGGRFVVNPDSREALSEDRRFLALIPEQLNACSRPDCMF